MGVSVLSVPSLWCGGGLGTRLIFHCSMEQVVAVTPALPPHTHTLPSGPPAPPHPTLELVNATTLQLSWYPPFTWTGFPIQNYTVRMGNLTNSMNNRQDNIPIHENNSNDTSVTFELSAINGEIARGCALLDFSVTAWSDLGESRPGRFSGGFPIGWLLHVPASSLVPRPRGNEANVQS